MTNTLSATPIKTSVFSIGGSLETFLTQHLNQHHTEVIANKKTQRANSSGTYTIEGKVLAITSKIVSLAENQIISKKELEQLKQSKRDLVKKEADYYLGEGGFGCELTIKHGILIPSAGIDESNSKDGSYILFPKDPFKSAENIYHSIKKTFGLKNFGVVITDSHTTPLRRGVTGVALSFWGFKPTKNLIGQEDLFGRELKFTHMNIADSLATAAVLVMGEGNECTPLAVVSYSGIEFCEGEKFSEILIEPQNDIYFPIFKNHFEKDMN